MRLIETIPNISEGRRRSLVADVADTFRLGEGAWLLDVHRDPSHHRSVITAAVDEARALEHVLQFAARAIAAIDLRTHRGAHPRMGAVDVVPFVPLRTMTMERAVALAHAAAAELAAHFELPVFLYGEAAQNHPGVKLHHFRRGGLHVLARRLADGELVPDFGPARLHETAGAVAVGARGTLIAYNVWLRSTEIDVARAIAREVRESSGGLAGVQAMGATAAHRKMVQVSTNLLDHETTGLRSVFDAVTSAARARNVDVHHSEIVGLIPAAATFENMERALKLESPPGVLEDKLRQIV